MNQRLWHRAQAACLEENGVNGAAADLLEVGESFAHLYPRHRLPDETARAASQAEAELLACDEGEGSWNHHIAGGIWWREGMKWRHGSFRDTSFFAHIGKGECRQQKRIRTIKGFRLCCECHTPFAGERERGHKLLNVFGRRVH